VDDLATAGLRPCGSFLIQKIKSELKNEH